MAIFSSHTSLVQRSKGENSVRSAAYNSRSKLTYFVKDKKTNVVGEIVWNYEDRAGLGYSKIHAPDNSPGWIYDREKLWNRSEEIETRRNSQTARKIMLALPIELTLDQNIELLEKFVAELVKMGMVVDANIHVDSIHNPHAHLMLSMRELKENRYGEVDFSPIKNREWGKSAFVRWHRELAADLINEHLAKYGFESRVSHLSYKEQGIDLIPTTHEGPARNISNAELVRNNREILAENAKKIRENPALILDKLVVNKPVFTKENIEKELEKVLSHNFLNDTNFDLKNKINVEDLEHLNKEKSLEFMTLYAEIMKSDALSLVLDSDLKGRTLYTTTKRLNMEKRYLETTRKIYNSKNHTLNLSDSDLDIVSKKEQISNALDSIKSDIKENIHKMFGITFRGENQTKKEMSLEQRKAVLKILNGSDLSILEGIPGSGKTVSMKEIVRQCEKAGKKVIGVAPSSAAALVLQKETGIECKNASLWRKEWLEAYGEKFDLILKGDYYKEEKYQDKSKNNSGFSPVLHKLINGNIGKTVLTKNHVMIIDEASMMELSSMDYLLTEAAKVGAKVIPVFDNNQLHATGWLGASKKLVDICGSNKLEESRRQQNPLHQKATKLFGQYKVRDALSIYMKDGSIIIDKGELRVRNALINDYVTSYLEQAKILEKEDLASLRSQVISTYTNEASSSLNKEIRQMLADAGVLKGKAKKVNVGDKTIEICKGEQIVFTRNYNNLGLNGIFNGEVGTVVKVVPFGELDHAEVHVLVNKADGSKEGVILDTKYFTKFGDSRLFDYGYAVTGHKLQGASVDKNFVFFEKNMGYEAVNVLFSRHREGLKCYVDSDILKDIQYEALDDDIEKAKLKYIISEKDSLFNAFVKLSSKRINNSFAEDYKDMGLSLEDQHLKLYIETVHKAVEQIREIASWQMQEYRKTGLKPELWHHEDWPIFTELRGEREKLAKKIVENYPAFKDRIIQLDMNYETIEKHANRNKVIVEEKISDLNKENSYISLVKAIDEGDLHISSINKLKTHDAEDYLKNISKYYSALKLEIADIYELLQTAMLERDALLEKNEDIETSIELESLYRNTLVPEFLSRVYKDNSHHVLSKYKLLEENYGTQKAVAKISKTPTILGELKGVGIGTFIGLSEKRRDAVANLENLEQTLLSYSRSSKIEGEYRELLQDENHLNTVKELDNKIAHLTHLLPSSLDERFLDEVGAIVSNSLEELSTKASMLEELKHSDLFESIKLGTIRINNKEYENDEEVPEVNNELQVTEKNNTTKIYKSKQSSRSRFKFSDVRDALNPYTRESIFREFAPNINPDGIFKKNGKEISCGSLNMDLDKGVWYRFSDGSKGDMFSFVTEALSISNTEALEILASKVGITKTDTKYQVNIAKSSSKTKGIGLAQENENVWVVYDKLPENTSKFELEKFAKTLKSAHKVDNIYSYKDIEGDLLGYTVRIIDDKNEKVVKPLAYCYNTAKNKSKWMLKGFLNNGYKPLYRAEELNKDIHKSVLIVEGEKTANSAAKLLPEYNVISWMGGAQSIKKVDWSQIKGREVIIWPDNDKPGIDAANSIIEQVNKANGFYGLAKLIDTKALFLPDKWDLADDIPEHHTVDSFKEIIESKLEETINPSFALKDAQKHNSRWVEPFKAFDILVKQGRVDMEEEISPNLYKNTLSAIALKKEIDIENSSSFIDDIRLLQNEYLSFRKKYELENPQKDNLSSKEQLEYNLTRDATIMHQIELDIGSLPEIHSSLIITNVKDIVAKQTRFNKLENKAAGDKLYAKITSSEFQNELDTRNSQQLLEAKTFKANTLNDFIEKTIGLYEVNFKQLEQLGLKLDLNELKDSLKTLPKEKHADYISNQIGEKFDVYLEQNLLHLDNAKLDATSILKMKNALTEEHEFKRDLYEKQKGLIIKSVKFKELALEAKYMSENAHKYSNDINSIAKIAEAAYQISALEKKELLVIMKESNTKDKLEKNIKQLETQTEMHDISTKLESFDKNLKESNTLEDALNVIDKRESYLAALHSNMKHPEKLSKEFLESLHIAYKNNEANIVLELDKKVRHAANLNLKEKKSLLADLKSLDTKDIEKFKDSLVSRINEHTIEEKSKEFDKEIKESQTLEAALKSLESKYSYFAGLYDTAEKNTYSSHIDKEIKEAYTLQQNHIITKLKISAKYAATNGIISSEDLCKKLQAADSLTNLEETISKSCIEHNRLILKDHVTKIENGNSVKFDGQEFANSEEYLKHWKNNYAHHIIPIKKINTALDKIHQLQKNYELGL